MTTPTVFPWENVPACAMSIPANINPQPNNCQAVNVSPSISQPASAANTASMLRMTDASAGGACRCPSTCSVYPSTTENTPV